ncbi:MAG: 2OG-Fe(II) oxygenase [Thalassobaculaceae bacterium]
MDYFFKPSELFELAKARREDYAAASPFPHIVLDNFLSRAQVDEILADFPAPDAPLWSTYKHPTSIKQDTTPDMLAEMRLPPSIRSWMWQLNAVPILGFLTQLTGILGLLPDPYLFGGSIHQIPPGGLLKVHADFNFHQLTGLRRRLNMLIYLNHDWDPAYGGDLELWDAEMTQCVQRIAPLAGRCVIFNTDETSYHGHPDPLLCPPDRTRKSIALYYYTIDPDHDPRRQIRNTTWKTRPGETF